MKQILYIIFIIFNIISCTPKDDKINKLEKYLHDNFKISINKKKSYYFFVPNNQCKNCINVNNIKIPSAILENTYVITGLPISIFSNFKNVYSDIENKMFELTFIDY